MAQAAGYRTTGAMVTSMKNTMNQPIRDERRRTGSPIAPDVARRA
jgi:hypothetical protein